MLKINNLSAAVDDGQKTILHGLSLEVPAGEVHAIMGPNGAGKSTLSYVLTGREGYDVTGGDVTLDGDDLLDMDPEERAAKGMFLSFQYPLEIPGVPTMTFLKTALNAQRKARGEDEMAAPEFLKKARALAAELKMKPEMLKRPLNVGFSGGEKKRMEIFQMMMLEPRFILMDETDSGLDVDALRIVADGVNKLRSPDRGMLIITHYQRLLDYIVPDKVHVLSAGKIAASGDADFAKKLEKEGYDQAGLSVEGQPKFTLPDGVNISQGEGQASDTPMAKIAQNFAPQSWNIYVPAGFESDTPILIEDIARGHSRIAIMVDKGADVSVIEHHSGAAGAFVNMDIQIHLAEGAKLTRVIVHDDPEDTARIATACIASETGAQFDQFALSFGGQLSRLETRLHVEGTGFEANINGAYLLGGARHCDMSSHIDLAQPDCTIRQAVKGVVTDKARGVFQGKFLVQRSAQHTDAEMRHDALMLSETSEVRSKPELEIYADDVACAHGNTLGQLDESALFYMRQRGIPQAQAKALLTEAFLEDVFDDLEDEALRESILVKLRDWLTARS